MKPLVYVAAPFRVPDPVTNTRQAVLFAQHVREAYEVVPLVPHLSLLEHLISPRSDDYWLRITMDQMRCCQAVFRLPGFSVGADAEVDEAHRMGLPVFTDEPSLERWVKECQRG